MENTAHSETAPNTIKLVSKDGIEFTIDKDIAYMSRTLKMFFDSGPVFLESHTRQVLLPIRAQALRRTIEFMEYKHKSRNSTMVAEFHVEDDESTMLLDVAAYLRI